MPVGRVRKKPYECDNDACRALFDNYSPFERARAKQLRISNPDVPGHVVEDAVMGGFEKAIMSYDSERGASFTTQAYTCINQTAFHAIKVFRRSRHNSYDPKLEPITGRRRDNNGLAEKMFSLASSEGFLTDLERDVVYYTNGFIGGRKFTYDQISHILGLGGSNVVHNSYTRAMRKLRRAIRESGEFEFLRPFELSKIL